MIYDDDEIARILDGEAAPELTIEDPEILAETVVRVDLGTALGYLELYVNDRPDLALAGEEPQVLFRLPDGGNVNPAEADKATVEIRVAHLDLYIAGMQKAIDRARRMGALPAADVPGRTT